MAGGRRRAARPGAGAPSFLLAAALLAAVAGAGAQPNGCAANPSQDACRDYVVPQAALETDLSRVCANSALGGAIYSGWPSACTLWHECQAGRAAPSSCQPLALLQTACNEPGGMDTEICMTYLLLCAPGSKVQQCEQQAPIRQLKPPMQYYSAVQKLCNGTSGAAGDAAATNGAVANASLELELGSEEAAAVAAACKTCSAMSDDPAKVVVQATQANCPDPLGTLSTLCQLAGDAPPANASCAGWEALCSSDVGAGFWGLCGGAGPAPAPAPAAAEDNGRATAASAPSGQQPTAEASVKVPAAGAAGTVPAASAPAPAPANAGSSSSTATTSGGGSSSPSEDATAALALQKKYLHASMSAVILFKEWVPTSGGAYIASCLAIIAVAVAVQALKAMSQQTEARWEAQRHAGAWADTSGSGSPTYGHALSRTSMDSQNGHEPRRSSAMSTMPMLRGMGSGVVRSSLSNGVDGAYMPQQHPRQFVTRDELARNVQRALFTGATIFLDLMLMLVAMTFNLGLIICITLGYMLGALAFGHLKERGPAAAYAGGAKAAPASPTNPLFIVGSMQPTAEEAFDPVQLEPQRSLRQIHTQA